MGGFFQNLGLQAGYNMIYGQQQARAQADTELKQQQVLTAKAQLAQQAQLADVRAKVSQVAQAELAGIKDDVEAPAQKADFAMKAAARLEAAGDLQGAASWRQQAEAYTKQGKEAREAAVQKQAKATEDLAQAALAFKTAPSAENYGQLSTAIARSGGDISKMPLPGDPALPAFVEAQTRKGMKASDQLKLLTTEEDKRLQREEAARSHRENEAIRLETARTNAALRREGLEFRKMTMGLLTGGATSKTEKDSAAAMVAQGAPLTQVVPGFGRSAVMKRIEARNDGIAQIMKETGMNAAEAGTELANRQINYRAKSSSSTAGARTAATVVANLEIASNEAKQMIQVARDLASKVNVGQFKSLNAIENAVKRGTGDANIVKLDTALNSLVNSYARAINPKGIPTVSDKEHARATVDAALSSGQLSGIFDVMDTEMTVALGAAKHVSTGTAPTPAAAPTTFSTLPAGWH
jgi:hypothetical protein